ncbi:TPA: hypothetical protein DCL30_03785 [Candidatus Peribacteria bacterium]|nr:MAG: hypothetical protein A3J91_00530 [Candidatus Peribacteria bacterium RIFOXYC2_FULL_58_10]OGJ84829.1 MAG: hypothetical protein A2529_00725 [Candidatus Peribacteria bacterium RIFOXYD2_FULL_58_15]HAI98626.1 hypothetical protein [Candidatus Peribacteria bacterium]HAS34339.1 hypothetical protein [Candidatus Peribacteria bacterium]
MNMTTPVTFQERLYGRITDAIVIAAFTAWAYLLAYLYEYGYLSYFGIPSDFIEIGLINIIVALLWISGFLILFFVLGTFIIPFLFKSRETLLQKKIFLWIAMFVFIVFIPLLAGGYGHAQIAFGSFVGFLTVEIAEIIFFTKGGSLNEKIEKQEERESKRSWIFEWLERKIGIGGISAIALFGIISYLAFSIGNGNAVRKIQYPIIGINGKELAVVSVRQSVAIALPINREKKELIREIFIYDLQNLAKDGMGLRVERIGRLNIQDSNN